MRLIFAELFLAVCLQIRLADAFTLFVDIERLDKIIIKNIIQLYKQQTKQNYSQ